MGTFSGTVHVRGSDYEGVRTALEAMAPKLKCRFFLAPEVDGWITVFPDNSGQDARVSKELAQRIPGHVLHVILHDSDVFYYHYYRDGRLQDEYSSRPDYFKKVSSKTRKSLEGKPELLGEILRAPEDVGALRTLLASKEPDNVFFAHTLIESFGELLRLPYCGASYEDVESGEDEEIEGRDEIVHIPDLGPEAAQKKAAATAVDAEFRRFRDEGVLLWDETPAPASVCCDGSGQRFLGLFRSESQGGEGRLSEYRPPWQNGAIPVGLATRPTAANIGISPSGRYVATGHGFGDWTARLWDAESKQMLWEAPDSTGVHIVGFTADEKSLIIAGKGMQVLSVGDGRCLQAISMRPYNAVAALHPLESAMVVLQGNTRLVVLDFPAGRPVKTFSLEYLADLSPFQMMYRAMVTQAAEGARKKMIRGVERQAKKAGMKGIEEWKEEALQPESVTAESVRRLLFSADGRFLFCATDRAGWIFRWDSLLASEEETPKPLYRFCPFLDNTHAGIFNNLDPKRMVLSLAHDATHDLVLLGTGGGAVQAIDLGTGTSRLLLQIPDALPVRELGFSGDGSVLYATLSPFLKDVMRPDRPPDRFQIWDYSKLRRSGGFPT